MAGLGLLALLVCAALQSGSVRETASIIESWQVARAGQERAELLATDLRACPSEQLPALQQAAYDFFTDEMQGFRGRSAERMAQAMHDRARATWSMNCLSGAQLRTAQGQRAMQTVQNHLERIQDTHPAPELRAVWDRLGLVARGAGLQELMLDALGHSLAMGSEDALQMLGWQGLSDQDWPLASHLFGTLLDRASAQGTEPAPWALPGWGLALLQAESR